MAKWKIHKAQGSISPAWPKIVPLLTSAAWLLATPIHIHLSFLRIFLFCTSALLSSHPLPFFHCVPMFYGLSISLSLSPSLSLSLHTCLVPFFYLPGFLRLSPSHSLSFSCPLSLYISVHASHFSHFLLYQLPHCNYCSSFTHPCDCSHLEASSAWYGIQSILLQLQYVAALLPVWRMQIIRYVRFNMFNYLTAASLNN